MVTRKKTKSKRKNVRRINRAAEAQRRQRARGLDEKLLRRVSESIFGEFLHHKQVLSIALVTLGVIYTARMTIHAMGAAMAKSRGHGCPKHGIKQVDRFMSNEKILPVDMRKGLVAAVVGTRKHISVTMDWTDFEKDDQTTLALSLVMRHGRAIPFVWYTVKKSKLKGNQTRYERAAVKRLLDALPKDVHVTLLADRGFGNTIFFEHLRDISNLDFIIRFRQKYYLKGDGYSGKTAGAVYKNGRVRVFTDAVITAKKEGPYTVVLYKAAKMKESWCLATSLKTTDGMEIVSQYGRRFECEESFRDLKDWRFGLALKHTKIENKNRRERLLFAFALAAFLLTLVGIESERNNFDRLLRANTSSKRTHSLFRQGREIVAGALPDWLERKCLKDAVRNIATAMTHGFAHAMA
ncbi:MAG: IS4 family transposase [Proteobacteria bacterium]|nr:IS4 family transposase [Pseudomonadota bacterium]